MPGATFDISFSDDETPEFSLEWTMEDDTDFPWSDYAFTYSVIGEGTGSWSWDYGFGTGGAEQTLSEASGIAVDPDANLITFSLGQSLRPGRYRHGCLGIHIATGAKVQIFAGTLTITEGNFR